MIFINDGQSAHLLAIICEHFRNSTICRSTETVQNCCSRRIRQRIHSSLSLVKTHPNAFIVFFRLLLFGTVFPCQLIEEQQEGESFQFLFAITQHPPPQEGQKETLWLHFTRRLHQINSIGSKVFSQSFLTSKQFQVNCSIQSNRLFALSVDISFLQQHRQHSRCSAVGEFPIPQIPILLIPIITLIFTHAQSSDSIAVPSYTLKIPIVFRLEISLSSSA